MRSIMVLTVALVAAACADDTRSAITEPASFAKAPSNPTTNWYIPLDDAALALRSDGQQAAAGQSVYAHGACGVSTVIFANGDGTESGDATIKLEGARRGCSRTFRLVYPDGASETLRSFNNVRGLHNTVSKIAIGDTEARTFAISPSSIGVASRCGRLLFGEGKLGGGAGSDPVLVTRVDAVTWRIASQAGGRALCENNGALYEMPVSFTIVANSLVP